MPGCPSCVRVRSTRRYVEIFGQGQKRRGGAPTETKTRATGAGREGRRYMRQKGSGLKGRRYEGNGKNDRKGKSEKPGLPAVKAGAT
jgi:hypothetical protein